MSEDAPEGEVVDDLSETESLLAEAVSHLDGKADKAANAAEAERHRAILGMYLDEVRRIDLLTAEQEQALARRIQAGDARAEQQLIEPLRKMIAVP